jgi:hypothetical protein
MPTRQTNTMPRRSSDAAMALAVLLATASHSSAGSPHDSEARRLVQVAVERQLESLERAIFDHESAAPRATLLRRRFTVETFLLAGLVPQAIAFHEQPDLAPLWRFDFRDLPRRLESDGPWRGRSTLLGSSHADAIAGSFTIEQLEPVAGDDAVAIGGRFLATPDSVTLVATWCEPCLHETSVDFPILPHSFLLAWNASGREVATLLPAAASHREALDETAPQLDQPEDLYDLFDGLRPLAWVRKASDFAEAIDRSGRDAREPRGSTIHRSLDANGGELQRVEVETRAGELVVTIHQPPVPCRWRSGLRYDLHGDVGGSPTTVRSVVPEGEIDSLESPIAAVLRIGAGSITGSIVRGGRSLARLRWTGVDACTSSEAKHMRDRMRAPFESALASPIAGDPHAPGGAADAAIEHWLPRLDRLDPIGGDWRDLRRRLADAIRSGDREAIDRCIDRHRRMVAELALDPSTTWRACEQVAEQLAEIADHDRLARWMAGPWTRAASALSAESVAGLLRDRIAMGRFGAAAWLAVALADRPDATAADRRWAAHILPSLRAIMLAHADEHEAASRAVRPPWWEPPGRDALALAIADHLDLRSTGARSGARPFVNARTLGSGTSTASASDQRP